MWELFRPRSLAKAKTHVAGTARGAGARRKAKANAKVAQRVAKLKGTGGRVVRVELLV